MAGVTTQSLTVRSPRRGLQDITDAVARLVAKAGVSNGLCTLFIRHTSASLIIQENYDPSARIDSSAQLVAPFRIAAGATIGPNAVIGPKVVVGRDAEVTAGVRLARVVLWPSSRCDRSLTDAIVTPRGVVTV